jgi:HEAT repeat protein
MNARHRPRETSRSILLIAVASIVCRSAVAQVEFEGWNLEPSVGQAHLVMVARVASVGRLTVVAGAKTDVALREYRFQPIRRLKGLFQRDQLSMTGTDLGCPPEDPAVACPLKEGEYRLLILVQQQDRTWGCAAASPGATTFEQRVPLLSGPEDPLVGVIETLIRVADSRSRRERVSLLVDRLKNTNGRAAVPLLNSLRLRTDWAATEPAALPSLVRVARDRSTAVRSAALEALGNVLAHQVAPNDPQALAAAADVLYDLLGSKEPITQLRLSALEALGSLLAINENVPGARELLIAQAKIAKTHVERTAAVVALSRIKHTDSLMTVSRALAELPLDEHSSRESAFARAAVRADADAAEKALLTRLQESIAARQSLDAEVEALGRRRSKASLPLLLAAAGRSSVSSADRQRIAWALGRIGDDQAVPILAGWMRGQDYQLKEHALGALERIDSVEAAREIRPLLKSEAYLPYKLRIARLLARHELPDGYSLAAEHLADVSQSTSATLVLAALRDPRTANDLSAIIAAKPDRRWHAAALAGLAAIGDPVARKQLLAILGDDRHPLAADAAEAAGLAGDPELLAPLAKLVQSRNKQIAMSALLAVRRFQTDVRKSPIGLNAAADTSERPLLLIQLPAATRNALAKAVAALVLDAYVDADVRQEAFTVAAMLRGDGFAKLLTDLADQSELEGTRLLTEVVKEMRRQRGVDESAL